MTGLRGIPAQADFLEDVMEVLSTGLTLELPEGVPCGDAGALAGKLNEVLDGDLTAMGQASLERIRPYTYENMAKVHMDLFEKLSKGDKEAEL